MKTQLDEALLSARDHGSAETELVQNGTPVKVHIASDAEAITVGIKAPAQRLQEDVILEVLGILGHPPDAVYNIRQEGAAVEDMKAVWAHPGKSFEAELRPLVRKVMTPEHRLLMVSDRLYHFLVPNHPEEWDKTQVQAWQNFWNLRLREAPFREWIIRYTDPRVWDYFKVIAESVRADLAAKHTVLASLSPAARERMQDLFVSAAVSGLHLCYLHRRQHDRPLVSTHGKVDPERMTEQVLARLSWENMPDGLAEVVNEINITDVRESGELFVQAVQMPPGILNTLLSQANKCSVLGYITGDFVQGATKPN